MVVSDVRVTKSWKIREDVCQAVKIFSSTRNLTMAETVEKALVDFLEKNKMDPSLIPKVKNIYETENGRAMCHVMTCAKREVVQWTKVRKNPNYAMIQNSPQEEVIGTTAFFCEVHSIGLHRMGWKIDRVRK